MIQIQKMSIVEAETDAVVNAANDGLWAGGGVCGAIFQAAGHEELQRACNKIGGCPTGHAVITPGFRLKAKYIVHAVGPVYRDGKHGEEKLLYGAYYNSLKAASDHGCVSITFPLISAGIFGYPLKEAWTVAIHACKDFLKEKEMDITFAILDDKILNTGLEELNREE